MKVNKRKTSQIFLILGMVFFAVGLGTDNTSFTWIAITFIVISLLAGGRWMGSRRR